MDAIVKIGEPAPDFQLYDLNGELYDLTAMRGFIVIINFWSPECDWCKRVDDELTHCMEGWKERVKVWWIASNSNEPLDQIEKEARVRSLPVVLLDDDHQVADLYGAQTTPHFFVIGVTGLLSYQGAWDDITFRQRVATRLYVPEVIEALLNDREPEVSQTPAYGCVLLRLSADDQ
jgi:peroxiredoxin